MVRACAHSEYFGGNRYVFQEMYYSLIHLENTFFAVNTVFMIVFKKHIIVFHSFFNNNLCAEDIPYFYNLVLCKYLIDTSKVLL